MKNIAIIGSTGSIGVNALKVVEANPDRYRVVTLAAGKNIDLLLKQIEQFRPVGAAVRDDVLAEDLRGRFKDRLGTQIFVGAEGIVHAATLGEVDTVISAISGAAGLAPTYAAIEAGKNIALANKETMVMAGSLIMGNAKKQGISIVPIDSEHSAILQSLQGHCKEDLRRIILTASGGPFLDWSFEAMKDVTPMQALRHPNWSMGKKITIDSATLMNKGLEAIEAKWLFDVAIDQISILVHPQSIVHSMVEYQDGSIVAQMGVPDMLTPISYALSYPRHIQTPLAPLDFEEIGPLSFMKPDTTRFPCLGLAMEAAQIGGSMPAVLNGANEVAVDFFLKGKIGFLEVPEVIKKTMEAHEPFAIDSIEAVMKADAWSRETGRRLAAP
jgi:1-deoxy-D-xylulose-5-phosphate reductoisomerase